MFLIRSLITNKLRPYQKAPIHQTAKEGGCFPVYGCSGPLVLCVHALNLSQAWPVPGGSRRSIYEDKTPFCLSWKGGIPGPAGRRTSGGQESPGLQGCRLMIPDQLSCLLKEAGASCLACLCLSVSEVRMLVTKSQRCCEALYLARTWWYLSPWLHSGLAWGA